MRTDHCATAPAGVILVAEGRYTQPTIETAFPSQGTDPVVVLNLRIQRSQLGAWYGGTRISLSHPVSSATAVSVSR